MASARLQIAGLFLGALFAFVPLANTCQCGISVEQSPCNSLSTDGVVFLGTVTSIESRPWAEFWSFSKTYSGLSLKQRYSIFRDEVVVNFAVQEVFKGAPAQKLSIRVTKFLGSCGFEYKPGELYFKKGDQYLVYAGKYDGDSNWRTNHCSGTTLASNAVQKIDGYRRLARYRRPLVTGTYMMKSDKQTPAFGQTVTLMNDAGVRLSAPVEHDGSFLLTGISAGMYKLAPTVAKQWAVGFGRGYRIKDGVPINPAIVNVPVDGCAELELIALPDGKISGTVVDETGEPLADAAVQVWNANDVRGLESWWIFRQKTGLHGDFEVRPLTPGKYVVGVYVWSAEQEQRFLHDQTGKPTLWFYPGVLNPERAKAIPLGFAEHHLGLQIRVQWRRRALSNIDRLSSSR